MPLPLGSPVIIPARDSKVATQRWLKAITITCPNPQSEGRIVVEYVPMTEDGEIVSKDDAGNDLTGVITTNTLFADIAQIPELQAAMSAILAAVPAVEAAQQNLL